MFLPATLTAETVNNFTKLGPGSFQKDSEQIGDDEKDDFSRLTMRGTAWPKSAWSGMKRI